MTGRMETFGLSDIGLVRERNEDQFLIADLKKSVVIHQTSLSYDDETLLMGGSRAKLFLVADGISDSLAGERASQIAIQGIVQYLLNTMHWLFGMHDDREDVFLEDLKSAMTFTQQRIRNAASVNPLLCGIDTTITMAYVVWPQAYLVHVGGSRAYLLRDEKLICLTHDDTSPQAFSHTAPVAGDNFTTSAMQQMLSGLVGCDLGQRNPAINRLQLAMHDKLLLCTDGLTEQLSESQIAFLVSADMSAEEICQQLVAAANDAGGSDNTTVVLAHFTDREPAPLKEMEENVSDQGAAAPPKGSVSSLSFSAELNLAMVAE